MAQIQVEAGALKSTARILLQLVDDPDQVQFTHGTEGSVFIVPDEVAERFVLAVEAQNAEPPKKKAK
jgi:hypothetical protein